MASVSRLSPQLNVLTLMVVMMPSVISFLANSLLIKVPCVQQSNKAFFHWDSLGARLNSRYDARSYKKKKHKKVKVSRKSV